MENTKDSENGKVLYKCSNRSAGPWIRSGDPDGYTIIVYENGCVEYIHHRFEEGVALAHRWEEVDGKFESVWYPAYEPVWKKIIAENRDIADRIKAVLVARKDDIASIVGDFNCSCDGDHNVFQFGNKIVDGLNIYWHDSDEMCEEFGEFMRLENLILDINEEIAEILDEYGLGDKVPVKKDGRRL